MKKILALLLCALMVISVCGCKPKEKEISVNSEVTSSQEVFEINALTGLPIEPSLKNNCPNAIIMENSTTVHGVQTGLGKFDIVFETQAEGGISRMVCVSKNIKAIGQIGPVRSAREVFFELAYGLGANFIHWGADPYHFTKMVSTIGVETFNLNTGKYSKYGFRAGNGLSSEHTGYTKGEKIAEGLKTLKFPQTSNRGTWVTFNSEDNDIRPAAVANSIKAPISGAYITGFEYNNTTGKYTKNNNGRVWKDYKTGETAEFKNIFILKTEIGPHNCSSYLNDKSGHKRINLDGGTGYYASAGGYEEITWAKGKTANEITFKKADGTTLMVNAGNSYVCIVPITSNIQIS